ncbi:MAG: hypothetical protein IBX63_10100 [Coriobacteriia bacterium]|nr:hypothetical protein [Coriobacteriia bacterium]
MDDMDARYETAVHEAGHVVAHVALRVPFRYVTVRPLTPGAAGYVCTRPPEDEPCSGDDSDTITFLTGPLAQARLAWLRGGADGDLAELEHEYFGLETSASDYRSIPIPLDGSIEAHWKATHDLLERGWPQVEAVAAELLMRSTLPPTRGEGTLRGL